jgi:hypothetical protein
MERKVKQVRWIGIGIEKVALNQDKKGGMRN